MATNYAKAATACPAIVVPGAPFDPDTDAPTVTSRIVQWNTGPDIITASNQQAGMIDMGLREGCPGGYGIAEGLAIIDVVAEGIRIAAGVALIDAPRVLKPLVPDVSKPWIPNPNTIGVAGLIPYIDNQDNYCWFEQNKNLAGVAGSTAPPTGPCVFLGLVTMASGVGTIDGSGVLTRGWGGTWERVTGDTDFPHDAPPAGFRFLSRSRTASGDHLFDWDGTAYRYRQPADVASPAAIGANQNDYAFPTTAGTLRLSTSAAYNVTGLAGGVGGRRLVVINVGSNNLVLQNENTASAAGNRIHFTGGADLTLVADATCTLLYDGVTARWRRVA